MKKTGLSIGIMTVGLSLFLAGGSIAAPKSNKGKGGGKGKHGLTVSRVVNVAPDAMSSPVTNQYAMKVCVSGFEPGNGVSIHIPWGGTPESHSVLSFGGYVDSTGGFCIVCPPDWTELRLEPGTYSIKTTWITSSTDGNSKAGPNSNFTITETR
jgi:hypothetical protein